MSPGGSSRAWSGTTLLLLAVVAGGAAQAGPAALEEATKADDAAATVTGIAAHPDEAASAPEQEWTELKEAAAADAEARPARGAQPRLSPGGLPRPAQAPLQEAPPPLKEAAKAVHGWLRDVVPWAFSDPVDRAESRPVAGDGGGGADPTAAVGYDAIGGDPLHHAHPAGPSTAAAGMPQAAVQWQGSAAPRDQRRVDHGPIDDPVQRAIQFVRELLEHPMTWLIIALVLLGQGAVMLLTRLGKPAKRRHRRHRHRRRHR